MTHPARPTLADPAVLQEAAEMILDDLVGQIAEAEVPQVGIALKEILAGSDLDGYAIAKQLEACTSVRPTAALVRILDRADDTREVALDWKVIEWVGAHNVMPSLRVGDRVCVEGRTLPIVEMERHRARYLVRFAAGDVRALAFEDAKPAQAEIIVFVS